MPNCVCHVPLSPALDFMHASIRCLAVALFAAISASAYAREKCIELKQIPPGGSAAICDGGPCPPWYPQSAVRQRLEGRVVLSVTVTSTGKASSIEITVASPHTELNKAAVRAARRIDFPIYRQPGSPMGHCYRAPYPMEFSLQ